MPSVLVIGEALVDVVHGIDGEIKNIPGGSPANTAVALTRLGTKTYMKARTSSDQSLDLVPLMSNRNQQHPLGLLHIWPIHLFGLTH